MTVVWHRRCSFEYRGRKSYRRQTRRAVGGAPAWSVMDPAAGNRQRPYNRRMATGQSHPSKTTGPFSSTHQSRRGRKACPHTSISTASGAHLVTRRHVPDSAIPLNSATSICFTPPQAAASSNSSYPRISAAFPIMVLYHSRCRELKFATMSRTHTGVARWFTRACNRFSTAPAS